MKILFLTLAIFNFFMATISGLIWIIIGKVGNTLMYNLIFIVALGIYAILDSIEKLSNPKD